MSEALNLYLRNLFNSKPKIFRSLYQLRNKEAFVRIPEYNISIYFSGKKELYLIIVYIKLFSFLLASSNNPLSLSLFLNLINGSSTMISID